MIWLICFPLVWLVIGFLSAAVVGYEVFEDAGILEIRYDPGDWLCFSVFAILGPLSLSAMFEAVRNLHLRGNRIGFKFF